MLSLFKKLICSRVLLFTVNIIASENDEIALPSDWAEGTVYKANIVREKEMIRAGQTNTGITRTPLTIKVIRRTNDGYHLAWTTGRSIATAPKSLDELQQRLLNLTEGLTLVIRTDKGGTPEELLNANEVAETYKRALSSIRKWLEEKGTPTNIIAQTSRNFESLTDPERVGMLALKEPTIFFLVVGGSFSLGQAREFDDKLPNPITGELVSTAASMLLKEVKSDQAVVEWKQKSKPESNRNGVVLNDTAIYVIDFKKGWPKSIDHSRKVSAGTIQRAERIQFLSLEK